MPTKPNLKTCSICARRYMGRQCPECYTARAAAVQNTTALLGRVGPVAGPRPGDTVAFEDEPGVGFAILDVKLDSGGHVIARIQQASEREAEWVYVDNWQ